jgi:TPR repeat protein
MPRWTALLLMLAIGACSSSPERNTADIDSGQFDVRLARLYLDGTSVPRDDTKAAYLLSNASMLGDIEAKEMLGRLYAEGRGVKRDDELATALFRVAVDGGNVPALTDLGRMLEAGRGTPVDTKSALDFYERGMAAGDPVARENYQRLKKSIETAPPRKSIPAESPQITSQPPPPPA